MSKKSGPTHVVVDGSNIATEGRSMPSLAQLNEAVLAFKAEHPDVTITVVVDATFGHRIPKAEAAEFDAAVANNELVAPPAGAVGRGDAFVLGIAKKANATILSNDSFQEFHGDNEWLFDEGRVIGGKPVPHVGWVFVPRIPVRGPISRKAVRDSKRTSRSDVSAPSGRESRSRAKEAAAVVKKASREASQPMPVPTTPPPGRAVAAEGVNDLMPFLEFVERHPVGTSVNAIVDSYSSHGAYVRIGDVRGYVPLRLMGETPPRSAREIMKVGDAVTLVVSAFAPARRSIDLGVPHAAVPGGGAPAEEVIAEAVVGASPAPSRRRASKKAAAPVAAADAASTPTDDAAGAPPSPPAKPARAAKAAKRAKPARAAASPAAEQPAGSSQEPSAPATKAATKRPAAKKSAGAPLGSTEASAPKPSAARPAAKKSAASSAKSAATPAKKSAKPAKKSATSANSPAAPAAAGDEPAAPAPAKRTRAKRAGATKAAAAPEAEA